MKVPSLKEYVSSKYYFTYLGMEAQQTWADFMCWEMFFREAEFSDFVELGTGSGAMSGYFYERCLVKKSLFTTFDIEKPRFFKVDGVFQQQDIMKFPAEVKEFFSHPMCLFCDNGDKPKEVKLFLPYLAHNDYLVVHDFGKEITERDIPKTMGNLNVKPYMIGLPEELGSTLRFFHIIDKKV